MTREEIFRFVKEHYISEDLDNSVYDAMDARAEKINDLGINKQLEFLEQEFGLDWIKEEFCV